MPKKLKKSKPVRRSPKVKKAKRTNKKIQGKVVLRRAGKLPNKKSILSYKKILEEIKEQIISEIKQMSSDATMAQKDVSADSSAGHALHMADVATDMYDREFSLGLASNDRELLFKVDQALKKINDNVFGACEECSKPISSARLKAIPYAQTCLECQERLESRKSASS